MLYLILIVVGCRFVGLLGFDDCLCLVLRVGCGTWCFRLLVVCLRCDCWWLLMLIRCAGFVCLFWWGGFGAVLVWSVAGA